MPSTPWTRLDTSTRAIAVIGVSVMGRRICIMWVAAEPSVILCEKPEASYDGAVDYINNKGAQAGKLGAKPSELRVTASLEEAAGNAWMAIEAISEKLEIKIEILGQVDKVASDSVITRNSSSLKTSEMIVKTEKTYRICNGHYYMPPEQVYYEVMSCGHTDPDVFPFLMEKAAMAGFRPVYAKVDSTGLVFNRIWASIKWEVLLVLAEGFSDGQTGDEMFKGWFKAVKGSCQTMNTVGLDTVYNIEVIFVQQRGLDPTAGGWLNYVDKGNLGVKGGKGLLG